MSCYRKTLRISTKDHVTDEEVCAKIQQAIWPHEDPLIVVKRGKLKWYRHVAHSSGLAKTILQGTVKGRRRQDRQRKRWEDNIREWTGLGFAKSQRAVEDREKWNELVVKSSRLRNRWRWRCTDCSWCKNDGWPTHTISNIIINSINLITISAQNVSVWRHIYQSLTAPFILWLLHPWSALTVYMKSSSW